MVFPTPTVDNLTIWEVLRGGMIPLSEKLEYIIRHEQDMDNAGGANNGKTFNTYLRLLLENDPNAPETPIGKLYEDLQNYFGDEAKQEDREVYACSRGFRMDLGRFLQDYYTFLSEYG